MPSVDIDVTRSGGSISVNLIRGAGVTASEAATLNGVTVSGTPEADDIIIATSATTAEWAANPGGGGGGTWGSITGDIAEQDDLVEELSGKVNTSDMTSTGTGSLVRASDASLTLPTIGSTGFRLLDRYDTTHLTIKNDDHDGGGNRTLLIKLGGGDGFTRSVYLAGDLTLNSSMTLVGNAGATLNISTGGTLGTLAFQSGTFSGTSSGTNTGDQDLSSYATTAALASYATTASLGSAAFTASTAYDPAGSAAAVTPTTLGLVIGTNVQAYDADLTTWAGKTPESLIYPHDAISLTSSIYS